ncbi:MAG TPA: DUF5667 domain-containing protein [Actinomycetota bacterium]|jgi:Domain of unknown function (DUF5667)
MTRPAPARADEELDVVLDGLRNRYDSELGPAVEAARMLGAELRAIQIEPEVAERHIAMALARARYAAAQARWRSARRLAVTAVAVAALVVGPVVMLSGAALPGDALYPVKRTVEAADLALARGPASQARAHTHIARTRLGELHVLFAKGRTAQIPAAIAALSDAVAQANAAVARAMQAEGPTIETRALAGRLADLRQGALAELGTIAQGSSLSVSPEIKEQLRHAIASTTTTAAGGSAPGPPGSSATTGATQPPATGASSTAPPATEPPTTASPSTEPPTTAAPPPSSDQPGGNPPGGHAPGVGDAPAGSDAPTGGVPAGGGPPGDGGTAAPSP